jgi:hypothetical protein
MKKNLSDFLKNIFDSTKQYYLYVFLILLNLVIIFLAFKLTKSSLQTFYIFMSLIIFLFFIEIIAFFITSQLTIQHSLKKTKKDVKEKINYYSWLGQHFWENKINQIIGFLKKQKLAIGFILVTTLILIINNKTKIKPINQTNFFVLGIATIIFSATLTFQKIANEKWKTIIKKIILIIFILGLAYLIIFFIIKYLFWLLVTIFITWSITFFVNKLR